MLITGFNLATTSYRRVRRDLFVALAAIVVLALLLAGEVVYWASGRPERTAIASRLGQMEAELERHQKEVRAVMATVPQDAMKRYQVRVTAYNQILDASTFSWIGLLTELERAVPPGILLKDINPDLATGRVSLRGVARSFDTLTQLLHGLEQRTAFHNVFLLQQTDQQQGQQGQQGQPGKPEGLEFNVSLIYQPEKK